MEYTCTGIVHAFCIRGRKCCATRTPGRSAPQPFRAGKKSHHESAGRGGAGAHATNNLFGDEISQLSAEEKDELFPESFDGYAQPKNTTHWT